MFCFLCLTVETSYCKQVVANSRALAAALIKRGYSFVTDGTDNHLSMWDVRPQGVVGVVYM